MKKIIVGVLVIILLPGVSVSAGTAGQPVPWLDWGIGARVIGLGRCQTVIEGNGASSNMNPADLAWQAGNYLTFMHTPDLEKTDYDFFGGNYHLKEMGLGIGYQRLAVEGIEEYDLNGEFIGYFNNVEQALSFALAKKVTPDLAFGGTIKLIRQNIYTERGLGYGIDAGLKYRFGKHIFLGVVVKNFLGAIDWSTGIVEKPLLKYQVGISYYRPEIDLLLVGEYVSDPGDDPIHLGIEKGYQKNLRLRAGLFGMTPTLGLGLIMGRLEVDYALTLDRGLNQRQYLSFDWRY